MILITRKLMCDLLSPTYFYQKNTKIFLSSLSLFDSHIFHFIRGDRTKHCFKTMLSWEKILFIVIVSVLYIIYDAENLYK